MKVDKGKRAVEPSREKIKSILQCRCVPNHRYLVKENTFGLASWVSTVIWYPHRQHVNWGRGVVNTPHVVYMPEYSHRVYEDLNVQEFSELGVREYQDPLHNDDPFALGPANMTCTTTIHKRT